VERILSIDEFACRLSAMTGAGNAIRLAREVKKPIRTRVGSFSEHRLASRPIQFLAKVAADMQKPDGLTAASEHELPQLMNELE